MKEPDLTVIVDDAKKDPAYKAMAGKKGPPKAAPTDDGDDEAEEGKEEQYLGDAFDAYKAGDRAGFIAAMAAWRHDCPPMK